MLEHEARHLPGALSIPLADLPTRLKTLPKDKLIVTYCRARSALMPTRLSSWCWPTAAAARGSRRAAPSGVRPSTASSTALQPTEHARRKSTVSRVSWREGPSGVTSRSGSDRTLSVIQTRGTCPRERGSLTRCTKRMLSRCHPDQAFWGRTEKADFCTLRRRTGDTSPFRQKRWRSPRETE